MSSNPLEGHANPVLCVEDDGPTRAVLVKLLERRFDHVLVAKDGQEGLELFLRHRPSLVVTDIRMPILDGISMVREIKVWAPATKIVVITSYGTAELLLAAIEIGVNDYVLKPLSADRVYGAIDKCLQVNLLEHKLMDAKAQTENVLESLRDAFFAVDLDWRFTFLNRKAEAHFNLSRGNLLGCPLLTLLAEDSPAGALYQEALRSQEPRVFEYQARGRDSWHEVRVFPFAEGFSVYLRDITEAKRAKEEIRFLAFYDQLTRLPNRSLLQERVLHSLARCLDGNHQGAILFLDVDRFKNINDSLGHNTGDLVLQEIASRLGKCIRDCDTLARLGGDEFIVLLDGIDHPKHIQWVVERIRNALALDIHQNGVQLSLTASIGIGLFPGDGETVEDLLKAADSAMHYSKKRGGNAHHFFRPEMNARIQSLLELESAMRKSLQNRDFIVEFQPQIDLRSRELLGFEALVRWRHPELGRVEPSEFIPLAEQTGLILPLGAWVLEIACLQGRAWVEQFGRPVRMAVNVSGRQFWQGDLTAMVARVLAQTGFPPGLLELELTESVVMDDIALAIGTMHSLAAMGVRLSIDDFGTGYSSLASLQQFPIHTLKIDKAFVKDILSNPNDLAIAKAIIGLAHALRLEVIAEGIEQADQLACLQDLGCEYGQGHLFSRPVPSAMAAGMFLQLT